MGKLNKNNAGLSLGITFLVLHLIWLVFVFLGFGQQFLLWLTGEHFAILNFEITEFNFFTAFLTLIRAFIFGYAVGWFFSFIYNRLGGNDK